MYERPELIEFLLHKNHEDIRKMGEFIDDSEDIFLNISDINQLETCLIFLNDLKKKQIPEEKFIDEKKSSDEEKFLDEFMKIIKDEKYKDIGMKFDNSSSKYHDFYEIYTNNLNPNELNKEHIKKIYISSDFYLETRTFKI